jgi:hypothetical protein
MMRPFRPIRFLKRVYLWQLDGAVRYAPAVRLIRTFGRPESRILEVGSGALGITLFLPRPVTGYDVSFAGPDLGFLTRVPAASPCGPLPFADGSFDFVLSMDMLEHVPAGARGEILRELIRVTREWLMVTVPCGEVARQYDARLRQWLKTRMGMDHPWLREHVEIGLPDAEEIEVEIRRCLGSKADSVLMVEDNSGVDAWLWTWKFHMSRNRFWRSFKSKLLWPLLPWFARCNQPPAYRKVFIVHKGSAPCSAAAA